MVLQIEEYGVLLCLVCPSIVELDGLLGGPACKEQGQLSEDFVSVVGGGGLQNFGFLWRALASSVLEMDPFSVEHFL